MEIGYGKSEAILALKGRRQLQSLKQRAVQGFGVTCLRVRVLDRDVYIPLVKEILYLGAKISYLSFEFQTAKYRCSQAWASYKALRKVLRSNSAMTTRERLRIYRACVWTVMEYGVTGAGADGRSLTLIESAVSQQTQTGPTDP